MTPKHLLVRRFLELPFRIQLQLATALGVLEEADRSLADEELFRVLFRRITQKGLLSELEASMGLFDPAKASP